jgi:hypothetical protein
MIYNIYSLKDPNTLEIKYIGCTTIKLNLRLSQHIWDAKNKNSKKSKWLQELLLQNLKPIIELIEECTEDNWQEREMFWIAKHQNLSNTRQGGAGIILGRSREAIKKSTEFKNIKICQFNKKLEYIKTWDSIMAVEKELNILNTAIGNCLSKRSKSAGGYLWLYESDYLNGKLPEKIIRAPNKRFLTKNQKVALLDSYEGNVIKIFNNGHEAAKELNLKLSCISGCCAKKQKSCKNMYFKLI